MKLPGLTLSSTSREVLLFLLLTYGLSWLLVIPGILLSHGSTDSGLVLLGQYAPAISGMLLSYRGVRDDPTVRLSTRLFWMLLFWMLCGRHYTSVR